MVNAQHTCTQSKLMGADPFSLADFSRDNAPSLTSRRTRQRGGVLFTVVILMLAAAIVGASVLNSAINSLRLAQRNDARAQMLAIADSELEWVYFNVKMAIMSGTAPADLGSNSRISNQAEIGDTPIKIRDAYLDLHRSANWRVQRSVRHLFRVQGVDTANGGAKRALLDYIEVKIIVLPPLNGFLADLPPVRIGRYCVGSRSTIFQYGVFFNGDLELNPGENYKINGDIYASGDAYLAPLSGKTLTIGENAKLRLTSTHKLNGSLDASVAGTTRYNPAAPVPGVTLVDPLFSLTGTGAPGDQKDILDKEENLLGGLDPSLTAKARPDLFGPLGKTDPSTWSADDLTEAVNNVNRSLIVPPPEKAAASEYVNNPTAGDDSGISVQRAYNRAGIVVTVAANGSVSVSYKREEDGTPIDITDDYKAIASTTPKSVYDAREGRNIAVTEIDVAALKTKLASSNNLKFNGLLYVNLKNSTSGSPAAVRLANAESVPITEEGTGLSVATNGGLYVKGSYNSVPKAGTSPATYPSSMLMADAVTVLSYGWSDASANSDVVTNRVASVDNPSTPSVAETAIDINAGILTGNSVSSLSSSSGGAQNLVRYLENWSGKSVNLNGSLGRLFQSKQFTRPFVGTSTVYRAPNRQVTYDKTLADSPPAGSPIITSFSRGDVFRF